MLLLVVAPICHFLSLSLKIRKGTKRLENKQDQRFPPPSRLGGEYLRPRGGGGVQLVQGGTQQFSSEEGGGFVQTMDSAFVFT